MHSLASLYALEGKFAEAEPLEARAVEIWRSVLGEEHPLTLRAKNALERYRLTQPR
jgi:Tetratricopeptide repeat